MIEEAYVSFEVAKLLKEKGFDEPCYMSYWLRTKDSIEFVHLEQSGNNFSDCLYAPTHQTACRWLREIHGYYIQIMLDGWALGGHTGYYVLIQKTDSNFELMLADAVDKVFYETHEEAVEAALKYTLENLI